MFVSSQHNCTFANSKWVIFIFYVGVLITITSVISTLALGSRLKQGLAKVWAKNEAQKSHFMLLGVWESVRE
jgi:lipopolysaccharide export LptBFGC system permease protein LptF